MMKINNITRLLFIIFCMNNIVYSSSQTFKLDYTEVGSYLNRPIIDLSTTRIDFSNIHRDMATIEFSHHYQLNDSEKNLCLIRFTPIYEDDHLGDTIKICEQYAVTPTEYENIFFSSFDPTVATNKANNATSANSDFYSSFLSASPAVGIITDVVHIRRWAGTLPALSASLMNRFIFKDQTPSSMPKEIVRKWYTSLDMQKRLQKINAVAGSFDGEIKSKKQRLSNALIASTQSSVEKIEQAELVSYITISDTYMKEGLKCINCGAKGGFACSEQNALNYFIGNSGILGLVNKKIKNEQTLINKKIKGIVMHMHSTKHPCYTCGLNIYSELNSAGALEVLRNYPPSIMVPGLKLFSLVSYRLPAGDLPDSSSITLEPVLQISDPKNRLGLSRINGVVNFISEY